ncbi:MAG TPA: DUF4384 domain-containing protein [Nitrospiraceae bacterium]|nr:DUF4384 domain-containing protein [Nitrospiraceae bacterium]
MMYTRILQKALQRVQVIPLLGMLLLVSCAAAVLAVPAAIEFARNLLITSNKNYGSRYANDMNVLVTRLTQPYVNMAYPIPQAAFQQGAPPGPQGFPGQPLPGQPGFPTTPTAPNVYDPNNPYGNSANPMVQGQQGYPSGSSPYGMQQTTPYPGAAAPYDPNNPYGTSQGYAGQQGYPGSATPYGYGGGYSSQPGMTSPYGSANPYGQPGYPGSQTPYGAAPGYSQTPGYPQTPGYGQTPAYGQTPGYASPYPNQSGYQQFGGQGYPQPGYPSQPGFNSNPYAGQPIYPRSIEPIALDVALLRQVVAPEGKKVAVMNDGSVLKDGRGDPQAGDKFKIVFRANCECHVYVISVDGSGWAQAIFPDKNFPGANPVKKDQEYTFPADQYWFTLDQVRGIETIFFVASYSKRTDLEEVLAAMTGKERPATMPPAQVEVPPIIPNGFGKTQSAHPTLVRSESGLPAEVTPTTYIAAQAGEDLRVTRWFKHE